MSAASSTVRACGPPWSGLAASVATPVGLTRPNVGLIPTTPLAALGQRIDPPVSVPIDPKPRPAATETADPLEDRPDQRCESQGLRGALKAGRYAEKATSVMACLPSIPAPPCRRGRKSGGSGKKVAGS